MNNEERNMIHLQPVGEIPHAATAFVSMCDDDHFMASIYELAGDLIYVTFDSSRLWEEEVADHSDIVRHVDASTLSIIGLASLNVLR